MSISDKLKRRLIEIASSLVPYGGSIQAILQDHPRLYRNIDLESGGIIDKWRRIIDRANPNDQINLVMDALLAEFSAPALYELQKDINLQSIENIIEELKEIISTNRCVLFLGPESLLVRTSANELMPFYKHLAKSFISKLDDLNIYYEIEQEQNLSYLIERFKTKDKYTLGQEARFAKKVYENCTFDDSLFRLISSLNFPVIINTNHDYIMQSLFPEKYISSYYNFYESTHPFFPNLQAAKGKCVIYNVYGSFNDVDSIVLSEKDAVDFTRRVYEKSPAIPDLINNEIKRCYGFFVGFDFNEWHLKILFDVLELKEKPDNYTFIDIKSNKPEYQREYFEQQFKMNFIKNSVINFFKSLQAI